MEDLLQFGTSIFELALKVGGGLVAIILCLLTVLLLLVVTYHSILLLCRRVWVVQFASAGSQALHELIHNSYITADTWRDLLRSHYRLDARKGFAGLVRREVSNVDPGLEA